MSINYGLTNKDFNFAKQKVENQKNYMESHQWVNDDGEFKSLLDVSFSANLSKRYYPRLLNKVNTFVSLGISNHLLPVFLTVTLDGFFRDLKKGDYSRFTSKLRKKYIKHIPNNERNGKYLDYIDEGNKLTNKDLYKILSHQMHRFSMCETMRKIKKEGFNYSYIRVTEPHKDGTPHFHILMYLPEKFIAGLYLEFHRFFPAPRNSKRLTVKDGGRKGEFVLDGHYETQGFQIKLRNPAGYV